MEDYYVYEYIRLDNNEPFYVGKGHGDRWKDMRRYYNSHFMNVINKVEIAVNILANNLTEDEAFGLEIYYIYLYRDIMGYDMCNIQDGGEGHSLYGDLNPFYGKKHSEESLEKMRKSHTGKYPSIETRKKLSIQRTGKGNNMWGKRGELSPHWGKKYSEERKNNISKSLGTPVKCIELNKIFNSLSKAEQFFIQNFNIKFSHKTLKDTLENKRKYDWYKEIEINGVKTKLHWKYV